MYVWCVLDIGVYGSYVWNMNMCRATYMTQCRPNDFENASVCCTMSPSSNISVPVCHSSHETLFSRRKIVLPLSWSTHINACLIIQSKRRDMTCCKYTKNVLVCYMIPGTNHKCLYSLQAHYTADVSSPTTAGNILWKLWPRPTSINL